ncbi:hypothetical protein RR48_02208 [Papilio machaon]|uniref:Uncharacterized protein n=1 Tax=Papilio machaon TaxID=76193 RepID=A0A0N0PBU0_PAPMA|nr:hypothetical protein RR48_02208 [Papilio machaon]
MSAEAEACVQRESMPCERREVQDASGAGGGSRLALGWALPARASPTPPHVHACSDLHSADFAIAHRSCPLGQCPIDSNDLEESLRAILCRPGRMAVVQGKGRRAKGAGRALYRSHSLCTCAPTPALPYAPASSGTCGKLAIIQSLLNAACKDFGRSRPGPSRGRPVLFPLKRTTHKKSFISRETGKYKPSNLLPLIPSPIPTFKNEPYAVGKRSNRSWQKDGELLGLKCGGKLENVKASVYCAGSTTGEEAACFRNETTHSTVI